MFMGFNMSVEYYKMDASLFILDLIKEYFKFDKTYSLAHVFNEQRIVKTIQMQLVVQIEAVILCHLKDIFFIKKFTDL